MSEEIIDVKLGGNGEGKRDKELRFENFLEKNKLSIGLLIVGIILLGAGVLGFKIINFSSNQPKVEILGGENENPEVGKIIIEAAGEVQKPGVYELEIGSRVNDLLIKAGGLSVDADRDWVAKNINMASKLIDGAKIFIPKVLPQTGEVITRQQLGAKEEKININTASESELDTLWGVGPATAKKIISGRPFQQPEELLEKKIVKSNVWEAIKDKITTY